MKTLLADPTRPEAGRLPRSLGFWSAAALVVGMTIGSGIFRTPAVIATRVPDPILMLSLWVVGGVITLCGALSVSELAAALPETGGFYVYLREGWGRPTAFVFVWAQLVLVRASILGGVSIVFGEYVMRGVGVDPAAHSLAPKIAAAGALALAAVANVRAVSIGAWIVNLSTAAKTAALVLLIAAALLFGGSHGATFAHLAAAPSAPIRAGGLGLALISVLFTYDGFADVSMVAGEVKDPQRVLPRAILLGTAGIIAVYLLANVAYLYVLPIEVIGQSALVAADTLSALFGSLGGRLVSLLVALSSFSALMAVMLASPRIFFAAANDRLFFQGVAAVHSRYRTPYVAILLAAGLGIVFVLSQTFERLADTAVIALWPFYALSVAALYRLRRTRPNLPRPYRVVGYPIVPGVFIASVVAFLVNALISDPVPTLVTFAAVLAGIPVYLLAFARR